MMLLSTIIITFLIIYYIFYFIFVVDKFTGFKTKKEALLGLIPFQFFLNKIIKSWKDLK